MISIGQTLPKPSIKTEFKHSIKYLAFKVLLVFTVVLFWDIYTYVSLLFW